MLRRLFLGTLLLSPLGCGLRAGPSPLSALGRVEVVGVSGLAETHEALRLALIDGLRGEGGRDGETVMVRLAPLEVRGIARTQGGAQRAWAGGLTAVVSVPAWSGCEVEVSRSWPWTASASDAEEMAAARESAESRVVDELAAAILAALLESEACRSGS
ncbi:MAG: hypothetical protein JXX28_10850 [Deltaproteobacteria bacterium]|nr:hypothetical protein [Deltaproteobacteria bacterium]